MTSQPRDGDVQRSNSFVHLSADVGEENSPNPNTMPPFKGCPHSCQILLKLKLSPN